MLWPHRFPNLGLASYSSRLAAEPPPACAARPIPRRRPAAVKLDAATLDKGSGEAKITTTAELEELIDTTVNIPTIPTLLLEVNQVVSSPDGSAADAAAVIERDPAIGAKVLRLVNSSVYAVRNPVSSIKLACSIVGLKVIKNIVVQATVLEQFRGVQALANFSPTELWDHSFKAAVAARMIAVRAKHVGFDKEDAYTSGLIHDVGKMILLESRAEQFAEAVTLAVQSKLPLAKAEAQVFGFSHAHVGGSLANRWKLSPAVQAAVMYHHSPATAAADWAKGFLIAAANTMAHRACETPTSWPGDVLRDDSLAALGLSNEDWQVILGDVTSVTADV